MSKSPAKREDALAPLLDEIRPGLALIGFPAFVVDARLRYRYVNAAYEDYFGRPAAELVGRTVEEIHGPPPPDGRREALKQALAGRSLTFDRQAHHGPNSGQWARLHYKPIRAGEAVVGVGIVLVSIQHLKDAQDAIAARERQLALITDTIGFPLTYVDREGVIRFANAQSAAWSRLQPGEMIGRSIGELAPPEIAAQSIPLFERALAGESVVYERDALWPGRESRRIRGHMIPDKDASGIVRGVIIVLVDIEEDHRLQESLLEKEQELRQVIDSIPTPMVYVDAEQRYRYVNDAFLNYVMDQRDRIIGRTVREVLGEERHDTLLPVLERVLSGETVTVTRPIVYRDGRQRWMHIRYTPRLDAAGGVLGYYATTSDIHEQKTVEEELRRANSVLYAHFENTPLAVIERDPGLRVIRWSGSAGLMFGWNASEMIGQVLESRRFFFEEDAPAVDAMTRRLITGPTSQATILNRNYRKDGSIAWVEWHNSALRGTDGAVVSILSLAQDVTSRIEAEARLQHMATHDGLTGLPNRALLSDHLASALARALRSGQRVAVLFLDLDHFKAVNDTFGHRVGDELLRSVARRVRAVLRQSDMLARLSGDEFVIVLEGFEDDGGPGRVAQKVLDEVLRPFPIEEHEVRVSASLGYAIFPEDGKEPEMLLKNADAAMYGAKETGRGGLHAFSRTPVHGRD